MRPILMNWERITGVCLYLVSLGWLVQKTLGHLAIHPDKDGLPLGDSSDSFIWYPTEAFIAAWTVMLVIAGFAIHHWFKQKALKEAEYRAERRRR